MNTKVHALADANGRPLSFFMAELADRGVKVDYVQVWRFAHADG